MKYFTLLYEKDNPPTVAGDIAVEAIGAREGITKDPEFRKRAIATSINMFLKDNSEVCYIAANTKLKADPLSLYDVPEAAATVFRFENVIESGAKLVHAVWDVAPQSYIQSNCIMVKDKQFARDWLAMTAKPFFKNYNGYELDVLNMLVYYGDYKVRIRDITEL